MDMYDGYILVTGASSDIGKVTSSLLAKNNKLILGGRSAEKLDSLRKYLDNGDSHLVWPCDLAMIDKVAEELFTFLKSKGAYVSSFLHIAGICDVAPLRISGREQMAHSFSVNFFSAVEIMTVLLKKEFKRFLKKVLFVSSVAASMGGGRGFSAYSSSKGALEAYARTAAFELSPDITVNSIALGAVKNSSTERYDSIKIQRLNETHPLGLGKPADVANMIDVLLSDRADWMTGQTITLDGGFSVRS